MVLLFTLLPRKGGPSTTPSHPISVRRVRRRELHGSDLALDRERSSPGNSWDAEVLKDVFTHEEGSFPFRVLKLVVTRKGRGSLKEDSKSVLGKV